MSTRRTPVVIDTEGLGEGPRVEDVPPVPESDPVPQGAAMQAATRLAARRPSLLGRLMLWSFSGLVGIGISVAAWDFITGLLARNTILGQVALVLGCVLAFGILTFVLRELAGISRLARVDSLSRRAAGAEAWTDRATALKLSNDLIGLYGAREDLRLPSQTLAQQQAEVLDADALMQLTETTLLGPLDLAARAQVENAARQVATATALVPLALADVAVALSANIRMVRRVAEVYGGRAGTLGSLRLMRAVASHLVATGAVALGDDLLGTVVGGGALSRLSRRFGEGVVNGALTARVGIAAIEVCRPMPFKALPRPRVTRMIKRALAGLFVNTAA